ncbi:MAG: ats [Acidobacteria bacterium]|nr:ats [Acidobacteriota bacterium]
MPHDLTIRPATEADVPLILTLIRDLARYEKLEHEVVATGEQLRESLFGARRHVEVLIGDADDEPAVCFALFFHNFSTFLGRPGIYLEDLYVKPHVRGRGYGKKLLARLARVAKERNCGRFEWAVLDWNEPAIGFYKSLGAKPVDEWTIFRVTGEALDALAANDA